MDRSSTCRARKGRGQDFSLMDRSSTCRAHKGRGQDFSLMDRSSTAAHTRGAVRISRCYRPNGAYIRSLSLMRDTKSSAMAVWVAMVGCQSSP